MNIFDSAQIEIPRIPQKRCRNFVKLVSGFLSLWLSFEISDALVHSLTLLYCSFKDKGADYLQLHSLTLSPGFLTTLYRSGAICKQRFIWGEKRTWRIQPQKYEYPTLRKCPEKTVDTQRTQ